MAGAGDSARISPTAHYTAQVWVRAGLSDPALGTAFGAVLHAALAPLNDGYERLSGRPGLDAMLLARHRALDAAGLRGPRLEVRAPRRAGDRRPRQPRRRGGGHGPGGEARVHRPGEVVAEHAGQDGAHPIRVVAATT